MKSLFLKISTFFMVLFSSPQIHAEPYSVYLTWQQEQTWNNITVNHVSKTREKVAIHLYEEQSQKVLPVVKVKAERLAGELGYLHRFEIMNLKPSTAYTFKFDYDGSLSDKVKKFKTLPKTGDVKFLQGGDLGTSEMLTAVPKKALAKRPDVILFGGDLAYANGDPSKSKYWKKWLIGLNQLIKTKDNYLIPVIAAIGNHEVKYSNKTAPFFFSLFKQNGKHPYFVRLFSDHTAFIVLDSGFSITHKSQNKWLTAVMKKHSRLQNRVAMYHAPLYPSHRSYNDLYSKKGRAAWLPIFDRYHLTLAMENHDHAVKRTKMLIGGSQVSTGGTVYIGDGCWGRWPREIDLNRDYLHMAKSIRHVWLGSFKSNGIRGIAYDKDLTALDNFTINSLTQTVYDSTKESL
jgi:hypothetical protein